MTRQELVGHANSLIQKLDPLAAAQNRDRGSVLTLEGVRAEVEAFLRDFAGHQSPFSQRAAGLDRYAGYEDLRSLLVGFRDYVESGLSSALSPERQAKLDVVSDLLEQADLLLGNQGVHPGAAAMVIGATLEEFLRNWVEHLGIDLAGRKPGIQTYVDLLREARTINRQDSKDLVSWAGLRNHAAHGEWEEVSDPKRVRNMLDGVNLFLRKYTA